MNIVIVNDYDYIQGGASKIAIETANSLAQSGHRVIFLCGVSDPKRSGLKGVEVIATSACDSLSDSNRLRGAVNGVLNSTSKAVMAQLLRSLDPKNTVVHAHGWTKVLSSSVFEPVFEGGFKSVLTLHDFFLCCPNGGFYNYRNQSLCGLRGLSASCIKTDCDSRSYSFKLYRVLRHFVQNKFVGLDSKISTYVYISEFSFRLIKPYIDTGRSEAVYLPNPISIAKPLSRARTEVSDYFVYVGRLSKEKGVSLFCEAIRRSGKKAVIVGDGDMLEELRLEYSDYSAIQFVGWKDPKDVENYVKGARWLVFPSLWYETFGLTVCEALAYGVPCLVSDDTAASDFIDGKNGRLFKRNDVESLCSLIAEVDNDISSKAMSEYAFTKYWSAPFDSVSYERKLEAIYMRALQC